MINFEKVADIILVNITDHEGLKKSIVKICL
jgi:hypothetical protein